MAPRTIRSLRLALFLAPSALAFGGACGHDAALSPRDAGTDSAVDGGSGGDEASCAFDAGPLDDAAIQLGQAIIAAHKCFECHGQTLSGNDDGVYFPDDRGGFAYPPNLTSDPTTGLGCWSNDQIANAILNGVDNEGLPLCPPMPEFGHIDDGGLEAGEVQAVIAYLRSLPISVNQVPDTHCTASDAAAPAEGGPVDAAPDAPGDATTSDAAAPDAWVEDAPPADAVTDAIDATADGGDAAADGSGATSDAGDASADTGAGTADAGDAGDVAIDAGED